MKRALILSLLALGCTRTAITHAPPTATVFAPGVISDSAEQWRITFTPDGRAAYFTSSPGFFPITRKATIYMSRLRDGAWSAPSVAPFSGSHSDIDPFVSPDGKRLYFSSIRPVNGTLRGDLDIWMSEITSSGLTEPVRLGDEINSPADELYPSASSDGTLYFASGPNRPLAGQHWDIYSAKRAGSGFAPRARLGPEINTVPSSSDPNLQSAWEFNPEISADGRTLLFTSLRPGAGLGDIYVSHFKDGRWTQARGLGPSVNTQADEYHPTLSRDGKALYFVRRSQKRGDFHIISTAGLEALKR